MSTLGSIRKRSTLLLLVIGVAMLAFILGDFMQSTRSGGGGGFFVGEVAGEEISIQIFEERMQKGIENWKNSNQNVTLTQSVMSQIRNSIWDEYIKELLMNMEYEELGIDVDSEELFELFQGNNVHSEISKIEIFQDPATKQFDRARMIQYMKGLDNDQTGEAREQWLGFEEYISNLRKNDKYRLLVEQGMYVSSAEAQLYFNQGNENISFEYVPISFNHIADSLVGVSESEIEDYYEGHLSEYQQDESRNVDYVVFSVLPSEKDDEDTKNNLDAIKKSFEAYSDFEVFVKRNSDNTTTRFTFSTKDALQDPNWTELFAAEEGTVIGPYQASQGVYRIAKLAVAQNRPDSVEARHILIIPTQTMNLDSVQTRIDAIKAQVEAGADFGFLAQKNSEDPGSAIKGGDLGWFSEGAMVDEFNEACFTSKRGDLSVVTSQFGVHLIEVTKTSKAVRKVKVAFIDRNVEPSTETFNTYYSQAAQFAGKILNEGIAFDSLVADQNLVKRSDSKVTADKQSIVGLPNSREMVRWMNTAEQGKVSEVFQFENSYVVAYLKKTYDEGITPLEDIKEQISALVLKENKAAHISANIKPSDLATIAANHGQTVVSSQRANLSNLSLQGIGYEPELVGSIFAINVGAISNPIEGKNAVYVIEVTAKDDAKTSGDFTQQKQEIQKGAAAYSNGAAYKALNAEANVKDNRSDFY